MLFIGVKKTNITLNPLGMPGCALLTSPLFEPPKVVQSGRADWAFGIPLLPSLVGVQVYFQGFATDQPANWLGVTNSNGLNLTIG